MPTPTKRASRSPMPRWPTSTSGPPTSTANGIIPSSRDRPTHDAFIQAQALSRTETGTRMVVEITCASPEHMEQLVRIGVDRGTSTTMDNLVRYLGEEAVPSGQPALASRGPETWNNGFR